MTDTVCLVKPHLGMLCLHWRNLLPWTKQITTAKINTLSGCKGQGIGKCSSSWFFFVSSTRSLGKFGGLESQLALDTGSRYEHSSFENGSIFGSRTSLVIIQRDSSKPVKRNWFSGETDWVLPSHQAGDCSDLQVVPKPTEGKECVWQGAEMVSGE